MPYLCYLVSSLNPFLYTMPYLCTCMYAVSVAGIYEHAWSAPCRLVVIPNHILNVCTTLCGAIYDQSCVTETRSLYLCNPGLLALPLYQQNPINLLVLVLSCFFILDTSWWSRTRIPGTHLNLLAL